MAREGSPLRFPTFRGTGLRPGVSLEEGSALLNLMEGLELPPPSDQPREAPKAT